MAVGSVCAHAFTGLWTAHLVTEGKGWEVLTVQADALAGVAQFG